MDMLKFHTVEDKTMHKALFTVFAILMLSAGIAAANMGDENTTDMATVKFSGVAMKLSEGEMLGVPTIWTVNATSDENGVICSDVVDVIVAQAIPGSWGTFDENITIGDAVEVNGAYIEDENGCIVTLQGSDDYYFVLTEKETNKELNDGIIGVD